MAASVEPADDPGKSLTRDRDLVWRRTDSVVLDARISEIATEIRARPGDAEVRRGARSIFHSFDRWMVSSGAAAMVLLAASLAEARPFRVQQIPNGAVKLPHMPPDGRWSA